ncbi:MULTISPECIES: zinc ribbon domain-containing protein [Rhodanobacter]|uniref:zinc ribbon domain-containing protein n=1 Tax=Rhodanobacter TaxID=75309 RepID=UPI000419E50E|nr:MULTISPECIES: zinc ribbon domain-containing protein [Rhodanobacter]TAN14679.1 MAG: hypothetical protein EPN35_15320 [Rhodanobacter sp.]UJJ55297.1 hypothetical protein LRK53_02510 [Rhodanobacter thiooxydans]
MTEKATGNIGLLMRCYEALHNWQALAMLAGGVVIGLGLAVAAGALAAKMGVIVGVLLMLIALLVYLAGINGAGLLLVDQADGRPGRGFAAAFFGGLGATLNVLLALLLLALGLLLVFVALYLLALLGRIPGIGPLFAFLLAGPGAIVLLFCYGVLAIGMPLLLVAVWRGEGVLGSLGRAVDIVLKRPLDALLHFVLLWLIVAPVAIFVLALLAVSAGASMSMYSHGFGDYGYGAGLEYMLMSSMQGLGAASVSVGIVFAVVVALFALVYLFGYIMVYDSLNAGLASTAESRLRGGFNQLKQKVEQHRPQATAARTAPVCKGCGARLIPGDQFCGECGQRT